MAKPQHLVLVDPFLPCSTCCYTMIGNKLYKRCKVQPLTKNSHILYAIILGMATYKFIDAKYDKYESQRGWGNIK
jgi:hypothetical protein